MKNLEGLKDYQRRKRSHTREAVEEAIRTLEKERRPVNFKSVSELSGISRKTLYKVAALRDRIRKERGDEAADPTDAEAEIAALRAENARLRGEMARLSGGLRELRTLIADRTSFGNFKVES